MKLVIVETLDQANRFRLVLGRPHRIYVFPPPVRAPLPGALAPGPDGEAEERYALLPGQDVQAEDLRAAAREAREIYLATTPGRAGEALAWDLLSCLAEGDRARVRRVALAQLDEAHMRRGLEAARPLDMRLVDAFRARRLIDELAAGAVAGPLRQLWLPRGASLPAVTLGGMAALRLVVEREWARHMAAEGRRRELRVQLEAGQLRLWAELVSPAGQVEGEEAGALLDLLVEPETTWHVEALEEREESEAPPAPFSTLTLLEAAERELGLSPGRAEAAARGLYDRGLLTVPYTAAARLSERARVTAGRVARALYGRDVVAAAPPAAGEGAEEGPEAVRPASIPLHPDILALEVMDDLFLEEEERALYGLVWRRTVAAALPAARDSVLRAAIRPCRPEGPLEAGGPLLFRAERRRPIVEGFRRVYREGGRAAAGAGGVDLAALLDKGDELRLREVEAGPWQAAAPPRYTPAGLALELAGRGIGHPETYAELVEGLVAGGCARLERGELAPTTLGEDVLYVCVQHRPEAFRLETAAEVEGLLEQVAQGALSRRAALAAFAARLEGGAPGQDTPGAARDEGVVA